MKYAGVFALTDQELGCTDIVEHVIDTGEHTPIKQQPYRVPVVHRDKIAEMVTSMQDQGIIRPSVSPWASPVVLVPKKEGFVSIIRYFAKKTLRTLRRIFAKILKGLRNLLLPLLKFVNKNHRSLFCFVSLPGASRTRIY